MQDEAVEVRQGTETGRARRNCECEAVGGRVNQVFRRLQLHEGMSRVDASQKGLASRSPAAGCKSNEAAQRAACMAVCCTARERRKAPSRD
jgi:hypothetical protein